MATTPNTPAKKPTDAKKPRQPTTPKIEDSETAVLVVASASALTDLINYLASSECQVPMAVAASYLARAERLQNGITNFVNAKTFKRATMELLSRNGDN